MNLDDRPNSLPRPASEFIPVVYNQLRGLAASYLHGQRTNSLEPTALVHEAYVRLAKNEQLRWESKTHFFAVAAIQMRRVLVDHARKRLAAKRRGEMITLHDNNTLVRDRTLDILSLDEALNRLEKRSARQVRVSELRVFGGLTVAEIAAALDVSERTVKYDWRLARAWLARHLGRKEDKP